MALLHVRQLAWLTSRPEKLQGKSRAEMLEQHYGPERLAAYEVDPGPLAWLVDLWRRAGQVRLEFTMAGGVMLPLGWREMVDWIEGAQEHSLAVVFREDIMAISAAFADAATAAKQLECEAPFDPSKD